MPEDLLQSFTQVLSQVINHLFDSKRVKLLVRLEQHCKRFVVRLFRGDVICERNFVATLFVALSALPAQGSESSLVTSELYRKCRFVTTALP